MRLSHARVAPLSDAEMSDEQKEALKPFGNRVLNIFRTLVRDPKALVRFNEWGGYILSRRNGLPAREREIVILRTGFLCRSGYEWTQHVPIGQRAGLTGVLPTPRSSVRATSCTRTSSSPTRRGRRWVSISARSSAWMSSTPPGSTPRCR